MANPPIPTALDQLLVKQIAVDGVPLQSEGWLNLVSQISGVSFVGADNPDFEVNGAKVGSTDITATASAAPTPPFIFSSVTVRGDDVSAPGTNGVVVVGVLIADVQVIFPNLQQIYFVDNSQVINDGHTLTYHCSGGGSVEPPFGTPKWVYTDGNGNIFLA